MSTINAQNYGDGTDSVPASVVLEGTAKSHATYNQVSGVSVNESFNVSSVTDDATGFATLNFTNSKATSTFPSSGDTDPDGSSVNIVCGADAKSTSSCRFLTEFSNGTSSDRVLVSGLTYGDYA